MKIGIGGLAAIFAATAGLCALSALGNFGLPPFAAALIQLCIYAASLLFGRGVLIRAAGGIARRKYRPEFFSAGAVLIGTAFSLYEMFMMIFTERGAERLLFAPCSAVLFVSAVAIRASDRAKSRTSAAGYLESLRPKTATVLRDGAEADISPDEIRRDDIVSVKPNEIIPCDGEIIAGMSDIDEKTVRGELLPILRSEGECVRAGSLNLSGFLTVRAFGGDGELDRLIGAYKTARRAEKQTPARRLTRICGLASLPIAIVAAVLSGVFAGADSWFFALSAAAILLCPCGFTLVRTAQELRAAKKAKSVGVELREPAALSALEAAEAAVIDRTGTATVGKLCVDSVIPLGELSEGGIIRLAAALSAEIGGDDFVAVVEKCKAEDIAVPPCIAAERLAGKATGIVDGRRVEISSRMEDYLPLLEGREEAAEGENAIRAVFFGGEAVGLITLCDKLKPNAASAIRELSEMGVKAFVVSGGDRNLASEAEALGAAGFEANLSAAEKSEYLSKVGRPAIMIGDGVSDCAALRSADFSFALSSGEEPAKESASAVLVRNDIRDVISAIRLAESAKAAEKLALCAMSAFRAAIVMASAATFFAVGGAAAVVTASVGTVISVVIPRLFSLAVSPKPRKK